VPWLRSCLPKDVSTYVLSLRDYNLVILKFGFFWKVLIRTILWRKTRLSRRYYAYISSLIDEIDPRIILTFADNSTVLCEYDSRNKGRLIIYVQNAIRDTEGSFPKNMNLSLYYGLGHAETRLFEKLNVNIDDYRPVGSLLLGLFLSTRPKRKELYDICYISHYRPAIVGEGVKPLFKKIDRAQQILFRYLCRYARERSLSICVISKTRGDDSLRSEQQYYFDLGKSERYVDALFLKGEKNSLETYTAAYSGNVLVSLASTLLYEMYGIGKRGLFGGNIVEGLVSEWGIGDYYDGLPEQVKLMSTGYCEVRKKIDWLIEVDDRDYFSTTNISSKYYMAINKDDFPHEQINRQITAYLSKIQTIT